MDNGCATGARPLFARPLISRPRRPPRPSDRRKEVREKVRGRGSEGEERKKEKEASRNARDISDWKEKHLYDAIIRPTKTCIIPKRRVPTPLQSRSQSLSLRLSFVSFSLGGKRSAPYRFSSVTSRAASFFVPSRPPPPPPFAAFAAFRHHTRFPSSPFRETARASSAVIRSGDLEKNFENEFDGIVWPPSWKRLSRYDAPVPEKGTHVSPRSNRVDRNRSSTPQSSPLSSPRSLDFPAGRFLITPLPPRSHSPTRSIGLTRATDD